MEEIITTVIATLFGVSGVTILGLITTVITLLNKVKTFMAENSNKKELEAQNKKSNELLQKIEETNRLTKLLLDNVTKVQGYANAKLKEAAKDDSKIS